MKKRALLLSGCALLVAASLIGMSGCTLRVSAAELSEGYSREETDPGTVSTSFKNGMADFSLRLFSGLVTEDDENELTSPLSAALCLAMLANGAQGETRAQLEAAFGMDIDALNKSLYAFTTSLYRAKDCEVNLADSIWLRSEGNRMNVREEFLQANADWYDAQVYSAPFDKTTVGDINAWCSYYTDGMIKKIIDEIDSDTVMYLINAMTFDAKWADKYENSDVREGEFTSYGGDKSTVKMLSSEERTYISRDGIRGFAKNYSGERYSFVALLPDESVDIYDCIASLDGESWLSLWEGRQSESVLVTMPEFTFSASMNLNDTLKSMGMTDMFDERADFSGIGYADGGKIFCSAVEQKTFIQVDRNGTKAAAITWGTMKNQSIGLSQPIVLDRPFIYAIVDNSSGLPLFIGAVTAL